MLASAPVRSPVLRSLRSLHWPRSSSRRLGLSTSREGDQRETTSLPNLPAAPAGPLPEQVPTYAPAAKRLTLAAPQRLPSEPPPALPRDVAALLPIADASHQRAVAALSAAVKVESNRAVAHPVTAPAVCGQVLAPTVSVPPVAVVVEVEPPPTPAAPKSEAQPASVALVHDSAPEVPLAAPTTSEPATDDS